MKTFHVLLIALIFTACKKDVAKLSADAVTTSAVNAVPAKSEALLAIQCYNNAFYHEYGTYGSSLKAYYYSNVNHNGRTDFWKSAEAIETLIDAYIVNNDADLKNKIVYLYNGMRDAYGLLWTSNIYNDDVIWGALMCIRAFQLTNDGGMKDMAKNNFDLVWSRGWDNNLGGGIWWTTDNNTKNACVNAPAAICAMYLYQATGDVTYRDKAKMITDWMVTKLYAPSTGEVRGAINAAGNITEGARTYTQGTFIGACNMLHPLYPSGNYKTMGAKAMDYTKNVMSNAQGLLPDEYDTEDCQGFKGIFARWACRFVKDQNYQSTYGTWLKYNAEQAWAYRNSNGLMWAQWWHRTPDNFVNSFETTCGVAMMNGVWLF